MKTIRNTVSKFLIIVIIAICFSGCDSPDTYIYLGNQVPKSYVKQIKELGLLDEDETIKYFYSDGLVDIKEGLYFVTDKKLVIYCKEWEEPEAIIPFDEIVQLDVIYNDSFFEDTYITVETKYGMQIDFPVSSERKRDKDFFNYLREESRYD